jgi:hypothetical protein
LAQRVDDTSSVRLEAIRDALNRLEAYLSEVESPEVAGERSKRDYRLNILPVFHSHADPKTGQQISEKLYSEVCYGWRMLTDVRFRLLGLLPLASLAGSYGLFVLHDDKALELWALRSIISAFGLIVTIGLMIYEQRNDGLYNDMISRGRRIEYEWGINTGLFLGRRKSGFANHGRGTWTVYTATFLLWAAMLGFSLYSLYQTIE